MDPVIIAFLVLAAAAAAAALQSPTALRRLAARLIARAEAQEAYKLAHSDALRHWRKTLGVNEPPVAKPAAAEGEN